jgi:hypothetical protein
MFVRFDLIFDILRNLDEVNLGGEGRTKSRGSEERDGR